MENLITVLGGICDEYDNLLELSTKKKPVIISGDLEELSKITDEEQIVASRIIDEYYSNAGTQAGGTAKAGEST